RSSTECEVRGIARSRECGAWRFLVVDEGSLHRRGASLNPGVSQIRHTVGNARGRPVSSTATSTNSAAVTRTRSPWPRRNTQVSTPRVIDVRPVRLSSVYTQTTSPTFTGRMKLRLDTAAVATRPLASELDATGR